MAGGKTGRRSFGSVLLTVIFRQLFSLGGRCWAPGCLTARARRRRLRQLSAGALLRQRLDYRAPRDPHRPDKAEHG